jgi:hypothetical protein
MNSRQKVLVSGSSLVALMLLFPPWEYFDGDSSMRKHDGYHFLLAPPSRDNIKKVFAPDNIRYPQVVRIQVDQIRLAIQVLSTVFAALGLILALRSKRRVVTIAFGIMLLVISSLGLVLSVIIGI